MKSIKGSVAEFLGNQRKRASDCLPDEQKIINYMSIGFTSLGAAGITRMPFISIPFDSHSLFLDHYISLLTASLLLYSKPTAPEENQVFATGMMVFKAATFLASFFHNTSLALLILGGGYAAVFISNPDKLFNEMIKECIGKDFFANKIVRSKIEEVEKSLQ